MANEFVIISTDRSDEARPAFSRNRADRAVNEVPMYESRGGVPNS